MEPTSLHTKRGSLPCAYCCEHSSCCYWEHKIGLVIARVKVQIVIREMTIWMVGGARYMNQGLGKIGFLSLLKGSLRWVWDAEMTGRGKHGACGCQAMRSQGKRQAAVPCHAELRCAGPQCPGSCHTGLCHVMLCWHVPYQDRPYQAMTDHGMLAPSVLYGVDSPSNLTSGMGDDWELTGRGGDIPAMSNCA